MHIPVVCVHRMHTHIHIHILVCCVRMFCMYGCEYVFSSVCVCLCLCLCLCACVCVCVCVCASVCVCVCLYVYVRSFKDIPLIRAASAQHDLNTSIHTYTRTCIHTARDSFDNTPLNDAVRAKHDLAAATLRELGVREGESPLSLTFPANQAGVKLCEAAAVGDLEQVGILFLCVCILLLC